MILTMCIDRNFSEEILIGFSMSSYACIIKAENFKLTDQQLGCSLFQHTTSCEYVKASTVQRQHSIIHDCKGGNCRMRYKVAPRKVEQQKLFQNSWCFFIMMSITFSCLTTFNCDLYIYVFTSTVPSFNSTK